MKLTPWFDGTVKPVRPGVYERGFQTGVWCYAEWTGTQWLLGQTTAKKASRATEASQWQSEVNWRGLAEEPKS